MVMLAQLEELAREFRARAQEIDQGSRPPAEHMEKLARAGYYRFVVEASPGERRRALDLISSGCGVTAFLSTQHESVCRLLQTARHPLAEQAITGNTWMGVCFAHLRRSPSPVDVLEFRDHLVYSGFGPWFSGYGMMKLVGVAGATHEGRFLFSLTPVDVPEIVVKPLPPLAVMNATATVGLDFNALQVPRTDLIANTCAEELNEKDMHSTVYQSARSLGVARAAAAFLPPKASASALRAVEEHHLEMDRWDRAPSWDSATRLRQKALHLAGKVVEAAYVSVGGKAHLTTHPLQRISREAHFYSTTQLTGQLREFVLDELVKDAPFGSRR